MKNPRNTLRRAWLTSLASFLPFLGLPVQAQSPEIKTGLKAYWPFDGNFEDAVGIFDGTENGAEAIPFVNGKAGFGKAIKLNGEDQFVEVTGGEPDDLAFEGATVSIAGWFKVDAFDTSWQAVVAKGEGSNWRVARRDAGGGIAYAGGLTDTPLGKDVNDGAWHHFVAISDVNGAADGATAGTALYIDGALDTFIEGSAALAANGLRVMIGENPGARGREFEGELDDVAIWDRVLTPADIGKLWNGGAGKALSVLLGAVVGDADGDGMSDEWETEYGFNPNDPSDAALDFDKDGASNLDEYKAGTNPTDVTQPTLLSAAVTGTFDTVRLTFSEDLDPATATNAANYAITPNLAITAVSYRAKVVTLTTAAQTPGGTAYTVAVTGVTDTSKNMIPAGTKAVVYSYIKTTSGVLKFSYWGGINGASPVSLLTDDPRYPASPDSVGAVYSFNSRDAFPDDSHDNYGATIEGFVTPAESGDYRFFIYSDDASVLFLSTDDKEANIVQIAEETSCCNNFTEPDSPRTSEPIALVANKKYFIQLMYKEGGGGDYGQVAWRKEGDATPAGSLTPIVGRFLSSAVEVPYPAEGIFNAQSPAPNAKGVLPGLQIRIVHADGNSPWTSANVSLKLDGAAITPTFVKEGKTATITYQATSALPPKSTHVITLGYPDPAGQPTTMDWSFEVADYPTLTTSHQAVSVDTSKPGFIWNVFQNETFTHTTLKQAEEALAGKLMNGTTPVTDNLADPAAKGVAVGNGVKVGNLYKFEIATVVNLSETGGEANGNFTPDGQMPGLPGTSGGIDGIDAEVVTFVELPAGLITLGVNSDDGFRTQAAYINVPEDGVLLGQFDGGRGASDTLFSFVVQSAGVYPLRTVWMEGTGGANLEIFSVKADGTKVLLNDTANGGYKAYRVGVAPAKPVGLPTLSIAKDAAGIRVTFTGTLQSADSLPGTWTDVPGATSPATIPTTGARKFYRAKQ